MSAAPRLAPAAEALATVERVGTTTPREALPDLLAELKRVEARITLRLYSAERSEEDRFISAEEAAGELGLSRATLYRRVRAGRYSAFVVRQTPGKVQFSRNGLRAFKRELAGGDE